MQLIQTSHFERDYKKFPPSIQKRTDEKLKLLVQNLSHPSLRVRRVQKYKGVFEGSFRRKFHLRTGSSQSNPENKHRGFPGP